MFELWYDDELIQTLDYYRLVPVEGDIIKCEYDGKQREFLVSKTRNYFQEDKATIKRLYLKAWGTWDIA